MATLIRALSPRLPKLLDSDLRMDYEVFGWDNLGLDVPFVMIMYRLIMVVLEMSSTYEWSTFAVQEAPFDNWGSICSFAAKLQRIFLLLAPHQFSHLFAFNIFSLLDHSWKADFFRPFVGSLMNIPFYFSDDFITPIYVDRSLYPYDENTELVLNGSTRIGLVVVLRNFLRCTQHVFYDTASKTPATEKYPYLQFLEIIMRRLKGHEGKICLLQMRNFITSYYRTSDPRVAPAPVITVMLRQIVRHSLSEAEPTTTTLIDHAVLPCDHPVFLAPNSALALWMEMVDTLNDPFSLDETTILYLGFFRQHFEKLRMAILCRAAVLPTLGSRFIKEFKKISQALDGLDDTQTELHWKELQAVLDLYYVPHHLLWNSPVYDKLFQFMSKLQTEGALLKGGKHMRNELLEVVLDIFIMLPTFQQAPSGLTLDSLLSGLRNLIKYPDEAINKKAAWLKRRLIFARRTTGSIPGNAALAWTLPIPLLKYPSTLTMFLRTYANAKHLENSEDREYVGEQPPTTAFRVLEYYFQRLQLLRSNPVLFLTDLCTYNSNYMPISQNITESGFVVPHSLPRMYNFRIDPVQLGTGPTPTIDNEHLSSSDSTATQSKEKPCSAQRRLNFVPLGAVTASLHPSQPLPFGSNASYEKFRQFGWNSDEVRTNASPPTSVHPILFDEYPLLSELPESDIGLNERDIQFGALFNDCLSDNGLIQVLSEEEIVAARQCISACPMLGETFFPSILYKNHLVGWMSSRYEVPYVPSILSPTSGPEQTDTVDSAARSEATNGTTKQNITRAGDAGVSALETGNADAGGLDEKRVALLTEHFTRQLLDVIEATFDAIYASVVHIIGHATLLDGPKLSKPSGPNNFAANALLLFIAHMIENPSNYNVFTLEKSPFIFFGQTTNDSSVYNVFTHEKFRFQNWIPVTTYWKWLACMAQIQHILPHPIRIFCGKLVCALMKLDVEREWQMHLAVGEPLFHAVSVFGHMSRNPNINKYAPRLAPKSSTCDSKNRHTKELNEQARALDGAQRTATEAALLKPSATFFFDDLDSVPSYILHYLPLLLDAIDSARELVTKKAGSYAGPFRWLLSDVPGLIQGSERNCFQLAQFVLNQQCLRFPVKVTPPSVPEHYAEQAMINILLAVVRNSLEMDRLVALRAYSYVLRRESIKSSFYQFADDCMGTWTYSGLAPAMTQLLTHLSSEQLALAHAQFPSILWRITPFLERPNDMHVRLRALPIIPRLFSVVALVDEHIDLKISFKESCPIIYWSTWLSHSCVTIIRASRGIQRHVQRNPAEAATETLASGAILLQMRQTSPSSTYVGSVLGDEMYERDKLVNPEHVLYPGWGHFLPLSDPDLSILSIMQFIWLALPYSHNSMPARFETANACKDWLEGLHIAIRPAMKKITIAAAKNALSMLEYNSHNCFDGVKANGTLWRLKTLEPIPPAKLSLFTLPDPNLLQYGVTVVDRIVTVWFEDRPILLPSKTSEATQNPLEFDPLRLAGSSPSSYQPMHASGMKFWIVPVTHHGRKPHRGPLATTCCRVGFASKAAINQLTVDALLGCGDVPESWAVDDWQNSIHAEGATRCGFYQKGPEPPMVKPQALVPIQLEYDQFTNSMCVQGTTQTHRSPNAKGPNTKYWVPLPSDRNLTVFPCISFYTHRRFAFDSIRK